MSSTLTKHDIHRITLFVCVCVCVRLRQFFLSIFSYDFRFFFKCCVVWLCMCFDRDWCRFLSVFIRSELCVLNKNPPPQTTSTATTTTKNIDYKIIVARFTQANETKWHQTFCVSHYGITLIQTRHLCQSQTIKSNMH